MVKVRKKIKQMKKEKKEKVPKENRCSLCPEKAKYKILVGLDAGKQLCDSCMTRYTGDYI